MSDKTKNIDYENFGIYVPAPLTINDSIPSLDRFIEKRMGGKRVGVKIQWQLNGMVWSFDPWTGNLAHE